MKNPFDMKNKSPSRIDFDINPSIIGINVEILGEPATMHMLCKTDMPIGKFSFLVTSIGKMMVEVAKMYYTNFVDTEEDSIKANTKSKNNWKTDCRCLFLRKKGGGQLMKQYVSNFWFYGNRKLVKFAMKGSGSRPGLIA